MKVEYKYIVIAEFDDSPNPTLYGPWGESEDACIAAEDLGRFYAAIVTVYELTPYKEKT